MDLDRNFMTWQRKHTRGEGYELKLLTTENSFNVPGPNPMISCVHVPTIIICIQSRSHQASGSCTPILSPICHEVLSLRELRVSFQSWSGLQSYGQNYMNMQEAAHEPYFALPFHGEQEGTLRHV